MLIRETFPPSTTHIPLLCLPTELIIAITTLLDAYSLVYFKSVRPAFLFFPYALTYPYHQTCKALRDIVTRTPSLQYSLALTEHGLCDGPPSPVTIVNRLELVDAYEEAWRTFSWSKHLTLDLPPPHEAPYVSGGTLVLPIYDIGGTVRSFVVQSIPSPLRGVPERHSRIDFDFVVRCFIVDGTQDLLVVVPRHDGEVCVFFISLMCIYSRVFIAVQRTCACAVHWPATPPLCQWGDPSFGSFPVPFFGM
jgi:hypothetical protein